VTVALITSPDVLPEAMRYLMRTVLSCPGARCDRAELLLLVAPEGLPEAMRALGRDKPDDRTNENTSASGKHIAERSLVALNTLKLVATDRSDVVATDAALRLWPQKSKVTAPSFSRALRAQVWQAAIAGEAAPSDERVDDLVNGLAVLHAWPDPLRPFEFDDGPGRLFNAAQTHWYGGVKADWPVTNDVQFWPFGRWASYLGYAQHVGTSAIVADASAALRDDLRMLPTARYRLEDFVERCAEVLPISDSGKRSLWKPDDPRDISPGLSMTLSQLEACGHVSIPQAESDRDSMLIALGSGTVGRRASHLDWHPRTVTEERS
jgi:hypothetical protein